MRKYFLSSEAQKSLIDIYTYSTENFGSVQAKQYALALRQRMRLLAASPLTGRQRNELKSGYYSYPEGTHMIYYRIQGEDIEILDVLHSR